jgi:phage nucleotide-binding protein
MTAKRIQSTVPDFKFKLMVYGPPGSGKTSLIGSAQEIPAMRDILFLSLAGGASATLRGAQYEGILLDNDMRSAKDAEAEIWKIKQKAAGYENIKTLVLDDVSEVAKAELEAIKADAARKGQRDNIDESQLRDFMIRQSRVLRLLRMARDLPINVIVTAWSKDLKSESGKVLGVVPDFSDNIYKTLMGYFDACWYLKHDEATDKRFLVTQNYGQYLAKTRGAEFARELGSSKDNKFIPVMESPSFPQILAAYERAYTKEKK